MKLKELVKDATHKDRYCKYLTDEELAEYLWYYCEPFYLYTVEEITAAVKEIRNVH